MLIMTCKAILIQRKQIYRKFVFAWLWWSRAFCCNSIMGCLCPGSQPLTRIPPGCSLYIFIYSYLKCHVAYDPAMAEILAIGHFSHSWNPNNLFNDAFSVTQTM
jgi:hypothetical protein